MLRIVVDKHSGEQRLDRWMRKQLPHLSLSFIFSILRKKRVRVNVKVYRGAEYVQVGDEVCIYENISAAPKVSTKDSWGNRKIPSNLNFLIQNPDWVVIDKPSGMASQPGSGIPQGESVVEWLQVWAQNQGIDFKPALVQRLDLETSGVILAALSGKGVRELNTLMRQHKVQKEYLALVKGKLKCPRGSINLALNRQDSAQGAKMQVGEGKDSLTKYQLERSYGDYSLVRIKLITGRMHQIRAHFAHIGHPLLGDKRYGDFALNREFQKEFGLKRLFLHANMLIWDWENKRQESISALPLELKDVLAKLRQNLRRA